MFFPFLSKKNSRFHPAGITKKDTYSFNYQNPFIKKIEFLFEVIIDYLSKIFLKIKRSKKAKIYLGSFILILIIFSFPLFKTYNNYKLLRFLEKNVALLDSVTTTTSKGLTTEELKNLENQNLELYANANELILHNKETSKEKDIKTLLVQYNYLLTEYKSLNRQTKPNFALENYLNRQNSYWERLKFSEIILEDIALNNIEGLESNIKKIESLLNQVDNLIQIATKEKMAFDNEYKSKLSKKEQESLKIFNDILFSKYNLAKDYSSPVLKVLKTFKEITIISNEIKEETQTSSNSQTAQIFINKGTKIKELSNSISLETNDTMKSIIESLKKLAYANGEIYCYLGINLQGGTANTKNIINETIELEEIIKEKNDTINKEYLNKDLNFQLTIESIQINIYDRPKRESLESIEGKLKKVKKNFKTKINRLKRNDIIIRLIT